MNGEAMGGNYNQGDNEWEQLNAQDELNAEYGDELSNIDAELAAKQAADRAEAQKVGQQTVEAVTETVATAEPQVTRIPAEDPDKIRADAAIEEDLVDLNIVPDVNVTAEKWQDEQNNVDEALTNPDAQRATNEQLEGEYNEIEDQNKTPNGPTPGDIAGTGEAAGQQAA